MIYTTKMTLPGPSKVSPVIRFFRYTFLIAGIIYGATRYKALQIKESGRKEERERLKAERDAKLASERKAASERDIAQIVAIFSDETTPKFKVEEQSYDTAIKDDKKACIVDNNENKTYQPVSEVDSAPPPDQCEIFSKPIDLSDHSPILNPTSERKSAGATPSNKPDTDINAEEENEYFVETFKNGVPYAAPQNEKYDFIPKESK